MENEQTQLDPSIVSLAKAIGHQESGGDYNKIGDNGHSKGAYQWNSKTPLKEGEIPANFRLYAQEVGADTEDFSPANQDRVAYKTIEKWGKQGLKPAQIASKWNSGGADTYLTSKPGYNAEQGVNYDVKKYVDNVAKYYNEFSGTSNKPQSDLTKDVMVAPAQTKPIETENLKADTGKGIVGKTIGFLGDVTGTKKLGEGLGYTLSNAMGTQKGVIEANERGIDIQGQLLQQIKRNKAKGKDTTRLEKALKDLGISIQETGGKASDVGTGGITSGEVLGSALQTGLTVATAPSLIKGAVGLLSKSTPLAVKEGLKRVGLNEVKFNAMGNGAKVEALTEALKRATPVNAKVIQQSIDKLLPQAIKEAGGKVAFAELYPKLGKALGILGSTTKSALKYGLIGTGLYKGGDIVESIMGKR